LLTSFLIVIIAGLTTQSIYSVNHLKEIAILELRLSSAEARCWITGHIDLLQWLNVSVM